MMLRDPLGLSLEADWASNSPFRVITQPAVATVDIASQARKLSLALSSTDMLQDEIAAAPSTAKKRLGRLIR